MAKIWKLKLKIPEDVDGSLEEFDALTRQLLYNRGLLNKNEAVKFLNPEYGGLHSPFLFKDMQKAAERIWQAINENQKICIYGDYDADAVTANAVLRQTFMYLGANAESYIPDRFTEGYGINIGALEKIKRGGCELIITVDCGTNSTDAAEYCKQNNIDLIITDHHEIIGQVPNAFALINPKNPGDNYPDNNITGVGVAFKMAAAILTSGKWKVESGKPDRIAQLKINPDWAKWLLDLVAIGTVADCHSLLGENRILVKYGLKVLQKTRWPGLRALIQSAGLDFYQKQPDSHTLGFVIAPRLNAAGRLEHANIALDLLMENDFAKARERAGQIEQINIRRQALTERVLSEARASAELIADRKILALMGQDWPKGIVGLVAGRLAEVFYKPVFILEKGEVEATGSARTAGDFNLVESLKYASEHLVKFGGHKQAAGLTLRVENFELFYQKILDYADKNLSEEAFGPVLELEAVLEESDLQLAAYSLLVNFEPFGVGNPRPKFIIKDMTVLTLRAVGGQKQHLQLKLKKSDRAIDAIAFNFSHIEKILKVGDTVEVAAELIEDGWNGRKEVKLRVIDLRKIKN